LLHVDVKKLGRIARPGHRVTGRSSQPGWQRRRDELGWEYVHVCIDDASRLASVEILADERGETAAGFLELAVAWYRARGVSVERVMSDNGAAYRSSVHRSLAGASGPMPGFIATAQSGLQRSRSGSATTTTADHTAALGRKPLGARLDELDNLPRNYS
jgi:hypothetical protein